MTELDAAMQEHIAFIVLSERRPFSFRDLLHFKVDGKIYKMAPGTFRNKIIGLKRAGEVELDYNSGIAFYTLKGHRFGNRVTPNHTVVHNSPIYNMLGKLPFERQSIHDIHLRFKVPNIWKIFCANSNFPRNTANEDIAIPTWKKDNVMVRLFIHKTDTVSIIIGCSLQPICLDVEGIIRFFNTLVRIEERLQNFIDNSNALLSGEISHTIPDHSNWTITMWHFGRDCLTEYAGEKFSTTVENARHMLTRIYSKDINGKRRIRIERQEYPHKTVTDLIEEKLGPGIHG